MSLVVTFGELMLRLTTPGHERFAQATSLHVDFGGAEANVAVLVAQLGGQATFVTKLPDHELGQRAIDELQRCGVYTHHIARGGDRLGLYFLEHGASQRPSKVIYDRTHSSLADADPADFDWPRVFEGASWFHWSGITPALSARCAQITEEAAAAARALGLTVSFDMNYRAKLWTSERAAEVLTPLMKHVDVCIVGPGEAASIFGLEAGSEEALAATLSAEFGFRTVAITQRKATSASSTNFGALLFAGGSCHTSRRHEVGIIDRVGAGDALTGGLIYSLSRGDEPAKAVEFGVAAGVLKHTIPGDFALLTLGEVEALAGGRDGGRVVR
jgi:2-dehydro-3-deoxygluconokinase